MNMLDWEIRLRATLLVMDVPASTIAAVIGFVRVHGGVERLDLEADVRQAVEQLLPRDASPFRSAAWTGVCAEA